MAERTDHRAAAVEAIEAAREQFMGGNTPAAELSLRLAHVHATLELAEQQRIANLFSAVKTTLAPEATEGLEERPDMLADIGRRNSAREQVCEGLAL